MDHLNTLTRGGSGSSRRTEVESLIKLEKNNPQQVAMRK